MFCLENKTYFYCKHKHFFFNALVLNFWEIQQKHRKLNYFIIKNLSIFSLNNKDLKILKIGLTY